MNKMQKRGLPLDFPTMQTNIMDIAGVRVICSFEEDVFFLAKCLKKQSDIEIITEKDYISHPRRTTAVSPDKPKLYTRNKQQRAYLSLLFDTLCYDMQQVFHLTIPFSAGIGGLPRHSFFGFYNCKEHGFSLNGKRS